MGRALITAAAVAAGASDARATERAAEATPDHSRPRVLILAIESSVELEELARTAGHVLLTAFAADGTYAPTAHTDIATLFELERLRDELGCDGAACAAELAGAVGASRVVVGDLAQTGNELVLSLRLLTAEGGETAAAASARAPAGSSIVDIVLTAATDLLDRPRPVRPQPPLVASHPAPRRPLVASHPAPQRPFVASNPGPQRPLVANNPGPAPLSVSSGETAPEPAPQATFWTFELTTGPALRTSAETYYPGPGAGLQLSWGGGWRGVYVYAAAGVQLAYLWGRDEAATGEVSYGRLQLAPVLELRLAIPLTDDHETRIYVGAGGGATFEHYSVELPGGSSRSGETWTPELRARTGMWHRLNREVSLFAGYRLRTLVGGRGADVISELVESGSTASPVVVSEMELGCAFHF